MFSSFFVQVNIIQNVVSCKKKSIMITSLEYNVCLSDHEIFFIGIDWTFLVK